MFRQTIREIRILILILKRKGLQALDCEIWFPRVY